MSGTIATGDCNCILCKVRKADRHVVDVEEPATSNEKLVEESVPDVEEYFKELVKQIDELLDQVIYCATDAGLVGGGERGLSHMRKAAEHKDAAMSLVRTLAVVSILERERAG